MPAADIVISNKNIMKC